MHLSEQDTALYYELMWALQFHLKQTLNLFPEVETLEQYSDLPVESKVKVRETLYNDPSFIDRFVQDAYSHAFGG
jgi:outer membrane lipopolysaccharide assembly protein LptE/RlpB